MNTMEEKNAVRMNTVFRGRWYAVVASDDVVIAMVCHVTDAKRIAEAIGGCKVYFHNVGEVLLIDTASANEAVKIEVAR